MAIAKATIIENVHQEFYTLLNAITGIATHLYPAFPELTINQAESKSSYPIFILNSPEIGSWANYTLRKVSLTGTISVDIFCSNAKDADWYASDIIDKIETNVNALRVDGLRYIKLENTSKDVFQRGKLNIHNKSLSFSFRFIFDRSSLPY